MYILLINSDSKCDIFFFTQFNNNNNNNNNNKLSNSWIQPNPT